MSNFLPLVLFALLFVGGHVVLSSLPVRDRLVAVLGERVYIPLYATLATASLTGLIWAWARAPFVELWPAPRALAWVPLVLMPLAFWLLVEGLSRTNPGAVYQAERPVATRPKGLFAVTRHPGMWGFALWAASHLVVNGDLASVVMIGAVLVLALGGSLHIDARRRAKLGAGWDEYARHSSWLPFLALAQGRSRLHLAELGWKRPLAALVLYAAMLHLHRLVIGVSPLP
ncbi:MAG: NnrU family protein [Magnetospirillum sp.]|nr:NnrU family protein [Magnetospirillum sp.]